MFFDCIRALIGTHCIFWFNSLGSWYPSHQQDLQDPLLLGKHYFLKKKKKKKLKLSLKFMRNQSVLSIACVSHETRIIFYLNLF
jgi:hypothetical protein